MDAHYSEYWVRACFQEPNPNPDPDPDPGPDPDPNPDPNPDPDLNPSPSQVGNKSVEDILMKDELDELVRTA